MTSQQYDLSLLGEYSFVIHSYEAGLDTKAKFSGLCHFLQESAWNHAESIGMGFQTLLDDNKLWVLSRLYFELDEYPHWGDTIKVQTWPKGTDGLFALRDFFVLDQSDKIIGKATSAWLVLDTEQRRPQRLDHFYEDRKFLTQRHAVNKSLKKISFSGNNEPAPFHQVRYSDLDVNRHVNNVKYIEWLCDLCSDRLFAGSEIHDLEINFLSECKAGDKILATKNEQPELSQISAMLVRENDKKDICKAKIGFRK